MPYRSRVTLEMLYVRLDRSSSSSTCNIIIPTSAWYERKMSCTVQGDHQSLLYAAAD